MSTIMRKMLYTYLYMRAKISVEQVRKQKYEKQGFPAMSKAEEPAMTAVDCLPVGDYAQWQKCAVFTSPWCANVFGVWIFKLSQYINSFEQV